MQRQRTSRRVLAAGVAFGVIASGGFLLGTPASSAQAAELPVTERYAPSRIPDRITLTPGADSSTEQVISWRSSTEVTDGIVEYRVMTAESYPGGVQRVTAQQRTEHTADLGYDQVMHTATITGLQPGVAYMYRVGDGTNFSEWQDFETASGGADPFSFVYLGDVQTGIHSDASRVIRNAYRDRPNADLVLQIGDLVDDAHADAQWGELYDAFSYTLGTQHMLTTPGNHEYDGDLSTQWQGQFVYPANGPEGEGAVFDHLEGNVYYTDHEGVRFVSLNSNRVDTESLNVQAEWLDQVLTENPGQWAVVYFHHPIYSLDEGRNNLGIRQSWGPILEQHNVDLVLSGHDHAYGRGNLSVHEENLPEGADPELSHTGPVYVSASVGSKFYEVGPRHWNENDAHLRRLVAGQQTYQVIDVSGGTMRFEARTADGAFLDGFTIEKQGDQKLVTDGVAPQVIDPGTPSPCLGCEPNPDPDPDPNDPGEEEPTERLSYEHTTDLVSVNRSNAALPAGVAYHQADDVLYLGDQNGRTIFEIDPDTDTITRQMTLPENIRDLGIDEAGELLYVGQQNRNWVAVSIADDSFGEIVRGPFPIIESNRSLDVDPVADHVYVAVPARGVEVFQASTGVSLGVVNGTADSYYVAADPETGIVVSTKFYSVEGALSLQAFDSRNNFALLWERAVRPGPRQVDIDSTNGLLYVGYTGTSADRGGFSVHRLSDGAELADMVGPSYGKDGYGITVDEDAQRVFVANRDFRLNPPGEELTAAAVTVSTRVLDGDEGGSGEEPGSGEPDPGDGGSTDPGDPAELFSATPLTAVPSAETELDPDIRPVGSAVDPETGLIYLANEMRPARVHVIDPATDEIVRTMTAPTTDPVDDGLRDIAYDSENGLLYVAFGSNWVVMDAETGERVRGPFAFTGGVRGMDVDFGRGLVYGGTRGTGFDVADAETGELLQTVAGPEDSDPWRSHGIAYDPVDDLLYVSTSDAGGSTEGVRVFRGDDYTLVGSLAYDGADFRSISVDGAAGLFVVGHQTSDFNNSGASVYRTDNLSLVKRLGAYEFGDKVYGVSIDTERNLLFVSARERYPVGLIQVQLPADVNTVETVIP